MKLEERITKADLLIRDTLNRLADEIGILYRPDKPTGLLGEIYHHVNLKLIQTELGKAVGDLECALED